jgi:type IV pilus assembly protein PilE
MMKKRVGYTLIELMIVLAVLAILIAIAVPSYTDYVRKANRGEAQAELLDWANRQEIYRAGNPTYGGSGVVGKPTHPRYNFPDATVGANTFTLSAVATTVGKQNTDNERGTLCETLTINQAGVKTPPACWKE